MKLWAVIAATWITRERALRSLRSVAKRERLEPGRGVLDLRVRSEGADVGRRGGLAGGRSGIPFLAD